MVALDRRQIRKQPRVEAGAEQPVERRCIGGAERNRAQEPTAWDRILCCHARETERWRDHDGERGAEKIAT